jgi:GSH-dependent disulfide-bond oxidoreductase
MQAPIELFFWLTPNCWKISIALEEMELPYLIRPVAIGKGEQFRPEFLALSPNNRVPAIIDPDGPEGKAVPLFESGAILQYLGRKTGRFYPVAERARAEVDQWLFWQVGGVGPMFGQAAHFRVYAPGIVDEPLRLEYGIQRYDNEVNRLLGVLDRQLASRDFVAGDYTIADMALYPWIVSAIRVLGQDPAAFGRVAGWLARLAARPAVEQGMAAGAELRQPLPAPGSAEQRTFAQALFGQTAASVEQAASLSGSAARA